MDFPRDIFARLPRGWSTSWWKVWKLLKHSYGLVDRGRLWQMTVKGCRRSKNMCEIVRLPQLFSKRNSAGVVSLSMVKANIDLLLAGNSGDILEFHDAIARVFTVRSCLQSNELILNRLSICRSPERSIELDLNTVSPIQLIKTRQKGKRQLAHLWKSKATKRFQVYFTSWDIQFLLKQAL